ncbi:hypothetical protein AaE_008176 [Aphanomyces astaci]|uniref:Carboxypeptidase n=1 Tax=Aphanomyces astaci TaxID=112090 RepID=A0A6A5ABH8_APHAT|nr:hypothetical protein AaE_008176 [Aphanomyces astaci]
MVAYVASSRPTIPWPREVTPMFCDTTYHESGYIKLPHKANDQYFYWYFESRSNPTDDPLQPQHEGGSGTSSIWALLNENGPCSIGDDGNSTQFNAHSWTNHANMIWIDQPTGVGFSFSGGHDDDHIEVDVGRNVYEFLLEFFQANPFYIPGQSYGGHYVPAIAAYILQTQDANTTAYGHPVPPPCQHGRRELVQHHASVPRSTRENAKRCRALSSSCGPMPTAQPDSGVLDTYDFWDANLLEPMITNPTRNPRTENDSVFEPTVSAAATPRPQTVRDEQRDGPGGLRRRRRKERRALCREYPRPGVAGADLRRGR